ncbi:hypothetical protein GCM10011506_41950 [Marivirga lumbricoides]|uniref:histidine kinase n=1 Tax=Marivirga lumbricoides TaxID=1046115 RepID=A0ABQ1N393_9BACT|nr:hypothetical protein GCM10011506_41950 [Marivirga lumbricoides]
MNSKSGIKVYIIVALIGILMLLNIFLIYQNGRRINENQRLIEVCERVKTNAQGIRQGLHLVDLGLRAYVIGLNKKMYTIPRDTAVSQLSKRFNYLEKELLSLGYFMEDFFYVKSLVTEYFSFVEEEIAKHLDNGNIERAIELIEEDRGFSVAVESHGFNDRVATYVDEISKNAEKSFKSAVNNSYWLQIILFIISMPTLLYFAFYNSRSLKLSKQLSQLEKEKNKILQDQNMTLEKLVRERTDEILASSEEIMAQNEEISTQNDEIQLRNIRLMQKQQLIREKNEALEKQNLELREAKLTIEKQQNLLELRIKELNNEVSKQNEELKGTNQEMIAQNSKLEQFAYIISHNLRAPIARLLGLGSLMDSSEGEEDKQRIIKMMQIASKELNQVISDISEVLLIQKASTNRIERISLDAIIKKLRDILRNEIEVTNTQLTTDFTDFPVLYSIPVYFESIFYNLISNAIKYRQPDKAPLIHISSTVEGEFVLITVSDNGMGINLERDRDKLFGLYKRFHFHVEGKGLGLYLVKTQVEALDAQIEVISKPDEGCKFILRIDISKVEMP